MDRSDLMQKLRDTFKGDRVKFGVDGRGRVTDPGRIYLDGEPFICVKPRESRPYVQFWQPGGPEFENREGLRPPKDGEHVGYVQVEYHGEDFGRALHLCVSAFLHADGTLARTREAASAPSRSSIGRPYVRQDEAVSTAQAEPWAHDPDAVDRGLAVHRELQNLIADHLRAQGVEPLGPRPDEPQFDLAWEGDGFIAIVEAKSTTPENEEQQLRLGLGQLLRYRQRMRQGEREVRAYLAVERRPLDMTWESLCNEVGVVLLWPEVLAQRVRVEASRGAQATALP